MEQILDTRIKQELLELKQSMESDGRLATSQQLDEYYSTFRSRFGPDKLSSLDGVALLETMHSHGSKDNLVYWLEFKNDEEFPTTSFGSIAGGTAFKFGLFRKIETGIWTSGSSIHPIELSVEQAIEKARQHRDQLLAGCRLLEKLPVHGTEQDYQQLQQDMMRVAPTVSNLGWGHKYFSLSYPEKLDDFHNVDYQRFHLIRLLQLPQQNWGRYIAGGRFVAIAGTLNIPMNTFTTLINIKDGSGPYNYWRIGTSKDQPRDRWDLMRDGNFVAIGWSKTGDLSAITNDKIGKEHVCQSLLFHDPEQVNRLQLDFQMSPEDARKVAEQIFNFKRITTNDLILASDGINVLGIGKVIGKYAYQPSSDFPHRYPVQWLSLEEWQLHNTEGKLTTVWRLQEDVNLLETEKRILGALPLVTTTIDTPPVSNTSFTAPLPAILPPLSGISARIEAVLERKGQVILYGPPGTGKTYWAEHTARELAARASFGRIFDQLTPEQGASLLGEGSASIAKVRICSFHPAYGYEDFLEGFRPTSDDGHMQFVSRDGIFKQLCLDASSLPGEKFYLIIDEINRGDIPRIFGELLTILEKDKRKKSILLPLTNKPFHVPNNICVIGTMNTADRSIALLDTALRRRFGFIELMPDYTLLKDAVVEGIPLGLWLEALNRRICEFIGRDARNLQIGHAYLLEKELPIRDIATFGRVIQEDILPLLEEYCYEDYAKLGEILGSSLVDVKNQKINHELFALSQQDNLIDALLLPYPGLATSALAVNAEARAAKEQDEDGDNDDASVSGDE
jgi:5-methylcytosine-specific restriction enzyme B